MAEPVSTSAGAAAAGVAGWKAVGGAAGMAAGGAGLAALVVMLMTQPRSPREWAVGLITTVMGSIGGGAAVVMRYGLQAWAYDYVGLVGILGIAFACGLPAWAIVRWVFSWIIARRDATLPEVLHDVRDLRREVEP